jgi:PIN domain
VGWVALAGSYYVSLPLTLPCSALGMMCSFSQSGIGVYASGRGPGPKPSRETVQGCAVVDITKPTTHCYAEIALELRRKGKPIPTNDIWIAALCRQHSFPLLSRDRHFDWVAGNKRVGW